MQPETFGGGSSHFKAKLAIGLLGILLGAYIGALYAINNILLGYHG